MHLKNILTKKIPVILLVGLYSCGNIQSPQPADTTAPFKKGEWEILFDGKNTNQWKGANTDSFPSSRWTIAGDALVLSSTGNGDIITKERFGNFELLFDFKLTDSANSGVKYFVDTIKDTVNGSSVMNGPEYQIIDDNNHAEVKNHQHEEISTGALYLLYAPANKKLLPAGQWNEGKIIANGNDVEHWLNGIKVVSYTRGSEDLRKKISETKFKSYSGYGESADGHIMLTDHGDKVYFRNIKIKRL